jgi:dTDP-4-amino-4,6-dideoxygalactose transaminase
MNNQERIMAFVIPTAVKTQVPFLDLKAQYSSIREEIQASVEAVFESAHYVGGEWVEKFEYEFAQYIGAKYAVAVGSGTAALELALKAANICSGDEVIVPANSFFATAEAVSNVGAKPVFADVNAETFHLDASSVERCINPKTRAVIPVHLYGRAVDLNQIEELAKEHSLQIIEDACQAHGARCDGVLIGGAGRLTCFSFYPGKNLGAYGDAGAITCNDSEHAQALRILRDHGSPAKYHHVVVGTNSRLDSIHAAVLCVKLRHLDEWNAFRVCHATTYRIGLDGCGIILPKAVSEGGHNYHLFVIRVAERDELQTFLRERGIETGIHYPVPLHRTLAYQSLGYRADGLPTAEKLANEILSLPMYPELTDEQINTVIKAIEDFSRLKHRTDHSREYLRQAS